MEWAMVDNKIFPKHNYLKYIDIWYLEIKKLYVYVLEGVLLP